MKSQAGWWAHTDHFRPSLPLAGAWNDCTAVFTILPALLATSPLALYQSAYMLSTTSLSPVQRLEEAGLFRQGTPPLPSSGMVAIEGLHQAPTPTVEPQQPIYPEKSDQE